MIVVGFSIVAMGVFAGWRLQVSHAQRSDDQLVAKNNGMTVTQLLDLERRLSAAQSGTLADADYQQTLLDLTSDNRNVRRYAASIVAKHGKRTSERSQVVYVLLQQRRMAEDQTEADGLTFHLARLKAPGWRDDIMRMRERYMAEGNTTGVSLCDARLSEN